jgi:hypothetical protein
VNELPVPAEGHGVVILGTSADNGSMSLWGVLYFDGCLGMEPTAARSRRLIALAAWGKITLAAGLPIWVGDCWRNLSLHLIIPCLWPYK